jgi:predicted metal-binding membrane protein
MPGMSMHHETWHGAAAGYVGMWLAMMLPMMLPSVLPMLGRYCRSLGGLVRSHTYGLTALVGVGYFVVWALIGAVAYIASAVVMAIEMRSGSVARWLPLAAGGALLVAGAVQFTPWKARQLALCREDEGCGRPLAPNALGAWRHGIRLGQRCSLCCGSLMLALLAIGAMDVFAMAAVTLAISAERFAPAPLRVARAAGVAIVLVGVVTIAQL